jgi:hypothetical protein
MPSKSFLAAVSLILFHNTCTTYEQVLGLWKKPISRFWWIYILWDPVNKKEWFLGCHMSACMDVQLQSTSYSAFKCLSITGQRPVNMNILALKLGALQMGPYNNSNYFDKYSNNSD